MYRLLVPPYAEPVNVAEARAQIRIDETEEDSVIKRYIQAARAHVETHTGRQLVTAKWGVFADSFYTFNALNDQTLDYGIQFDGMFTPVYDLHGTKLDASRTIQLGKVPVVAVSSVTYTDPLGAAQTVSAANYGIVYSEPARVSPGFGLAWPQTHLVPNAACVTFISGHATPFVVDATANTVTAKGRTFTVNDVVRLSNSGGSLPAPLETYTDYYVKTTGATFQLALTSGGSAIDFSDAGTGTQFLGEIPTPAIQAILLLVDHWFNNRGAVVIGAMSREMDLAVGSLIDDLKYTLHA